MWSFLVNFSPEVYKLTLSVITEGASEEALRKSKLIERLTMPNKIDGKVTLIPTIPIIRPAPPPPRCQDNNYHNSSHLDNLLPWSSHHQTNPSHQAKEPAYLWPFPTGLVKANTT